MFQSYFLILLCFCQYSIGAYPRRLNFTASDSRKFVHYEIYFNHEVTNMDTDSKFCYLNSTEEMIHSYVNRCANPVYSLRVMQPSQISWRNVNKKKKKSPKDTLSSTGNLSQNLNISQNSDIDEFEDIDSDGDVISKTGTIVHELMAFGLILPSHPFSNDLYLSMNVIAPMFPNVKIVVGNGYKFKQLCAQYGVNSFPQLLLFNKGLLHSKYPGDSSPHALAEEFTKWTNTFPKAYPVKKRLQQRSNFLLPSTSVNRILSNSTFNGSQNATTRFQSLSETFRPLLDIIENYLIPFRLEYSLEPVNGSFEYITAWDERGYLWLLSGSYVASRLVFATWVLIRSKILANR